MSSKLSWSANNCPFFLHVFQISPRQCRSFDRSGKVTDGANIHIFFTFSDCSSFPCFFSLLLFPGGATRCARSPPLPGLFGRSQHLEQPGLWKPGQVIFHTILPLLFNMTLWKKFIMQFVLGVQKLSQF